jgi:soluble P-type ATPase
MPTYRVTDPTTGRTLSLSGDSPPTEKELEDIFSEYTVDPERQQLEKEFQQAEQERSQAAYNLEAAEDTVLENLAEGIQQTSAAGVGAVADLATFVASPATALYELSTGQDVPTGREALAMIDPRLDPNQRFVEEDVGAFATRLAGELSVLGGGFAQVARDPAKLSSAIKDIAGLGMTKTPVAATALKEGPEFAERLSKNTIDLDLDFNLETVEGVKNFADDAGIRFDVEQARPDFDSFEQWKKIDLPKFKVDQEKLGNKWDAAAKSLNKAIERNQKALESGDEARVLKSEANLSNAQAKLDNLSNQVVEAPLPPPIIKGSADRRAFIKNELSVAGVSDDVIKSVVLPQRYRKPKPFEELMEYDKMAMNGVYDINPKAVVRFLDEASRPASAVVTKLAGPRIGALFSSSFETATRKQELLYTKYFNDKAKNHLSELVDWGNSPVNKAMFLDLHLEPENLKTIITNASDELSKPAYNLFKQLLADSKIHQADVKSLYTKDVLQDEVYWASGVKRSSLNDEESLATTIETGTIQNAGAKERKRKLAQEMDLDDLNDYSSPILEQINRIAQEGMLVELSKSFRMRPSIGLNGNSNDFFREMRRAVQDQTGSPKVADQISQLTNRTYVGARTNTSSFVSAWMKQAYGGTLGQFDSALLNLHDTAISLVRDGVKPTLKGILDREGMVIQDFGIGGSNKNIGEFQSGFDEGLDKAFYEKAADFYQDFSFKYSIFRVADRKGKGIVLRSAFNGMREAASSTQQFKDKYDIYFSARERALIRPYLIKGTKIEDMPESAKHIVLRGMFTRLGEQQLISPAGRTLKYLNKPTASLLRPLYALSGFAIMQGELLKQGIIDNISKGNYKEAGSFSARYMAFAGLGYGLIDEIRGIPQWILGNDDKEPSIEDVLVKAATQPIQVATFGRLGDSYSTQKFLDSPVEYLLESLVPPTGFIGNLSKDVADVAAGKDVNYETLKSLPGGEELRAVLTEDK